MRKENVSTHIQRKHPNQYNPFPQMKLKQSDCNFAQPKKPKPSNFSSPQYETVNFRISQYNLSNPAEFFENSSKFQNVLQEIMQWDKFELACLLTAVFKLPNFIS
jgi:hypothetical protein